MNNRLPVVRNEKEFQAKIAMCGLLAQDLLRILEKIILATGLKKLPSEIIDYRGFRRIIVIRDLRIASTEKYLILVTERFIKGDLFSYFLILARPVPKMIRTHAYFVDEKAGCIKRLWVLPADVPMEGLEVQKGAEIILQNAKGISINPN